MHGARFGMCGVWCVHMNGSYMDIVMVMSHRVLHIT